jgi:hypothetical protein
MPGSVERQTIMRGTLTAVEIRSNAPTGAGCSAYLDSILISRVPTGLHPHAELAMLDQQ